MIIDIHTPDKNGDFITLLRAETETFEGKTVTVHRGFHYDGASVPWLFWRIVFPPVHPKSRRAGCFHDYITRKQPKGWTRKDADRFFHYLLIKDGTNRFSAMLAYIGVRCFGWIAWNRYAKERAKK